MGKGTQFSVQNLINALRNPSKVTGLDVQYTNERYLGPSKNGRDFSVPEDSETVYACAYGVGALLLGEKTWMNVSVRDINEAFGLDYATGARMEWKSDYYGWGEAADYLEETFSTERQPA